MFALLKGRDVEHRGRGRRGWFSPLLRNLLCPGDVGPELGGRVVCERERGDRLALRTPVQRRRDIRKHRTSFCKRSIALLVVKHLHEEIAQQHALHRADHHDEDEVGIGIDITKCFRKGSKERVHTFEERDKLFRDGGEKHNVGSAFFRALGALLRTVLTSRLSCRLSVSSYRKRRSA